MPAYRIVTIPTSVVESVRTTRRSPRYGHPAHSEIATGLGPCRHCLRAFRIDKENRVLFTYDSFAGREDFPLPGPVFVHERPCDPYPAEGPFPSDLRGYPLTFNAYGAGRNLRAQEFVTDDDDVEDLIAALLSRADVDYIQVHDTEAGCFDFRIER